MSCVELHRAHAPEFVLQLSGINGAAVILEGLSRGEDNLAEFHKGPKSSLSMIQAKPA